MYRSKRLAARVALLRKNVNVSRRPAKVTAVRSRFTMSSAKYQPSSKIASRESRYKARMKIKKPEVPSTPVDTMTTRTRSNVRTSQVKATVEKNAPDKVPNKLPIQKITPVMPAAPKLLTRAERLRARSKAQAKSQAKSQANSLPTKKLNSDTMKTKGAKLADTSVRTALTRTSERTTRQQCLSEAKSPEKRITRRCVRDDPKSVESKQIHTAVKMEKETNLRKRPLRNNSEEGLPNQKNVKKRITRNDTEDLHPASWLKSLKKPAPFDADWEYTEKKRKTVGHVSSTRTTRSRAVESKIDMDMLDLKTRMQMMDDVKTTGTTSPKPKLVSDVSPKPATVHKREIIDDEDMKSRPHLRNRSFAKAKSRIHQKKPKKSTDDDWVPGVHRIKPKKSRIQSTQASSPSEKGKFSLTVKAHLSVKDMKHESKVKAKSKSNVDTSKSSVKAKVVTHGTTPVSKVGSKRALSPRADQLDSEPQPKRSSLTMKIVVPKAFKLSKESGSVSKSPPKTVKGVSSTPTGHDSTPKVQPLILKLSTGTFTKCNEENGRTSSAAVNIVSSHDGPTSDESKSRPRPRLRAKKVESALPHDVLFSEGSDTHGDSSEEEYQHKLLRRRKELRENKKRARLEKRARKEAQKEVQRVELQRMDPSDKLMSKAAEDNLETMLPQPELDMKDDTMDEAKWVAEKYKKHCHEVVKNAQPLETIVGGDYKCKLCSDVSFDRLTNLSRHILEIHAKQPSHLQHGKYTICPFTG